MDSDELVDRQVQAGRELLARLSNDGVKISAAFWAKAADEAHWFLYLSTPLVEESGLAKAYSTVLDSLLKLEGTPLSFADIKLIGVTTPIALDVSGILEKNPGMQGKRYGARILGDIAVDQVYIYPSHLLGVESARKARKEFLLGDLMKNLMRGPGEFPPDSITLVDGSHFYGWLKTLHMDSDGEGFAEFIVSGGGGERSLNVEQIASIESVSALPAAL